MIMGYNTHKNEYLSMIFRDESHKSEYLSINMEYNTYKSEYLSEILNIIAIKVNI
jgi:hypothetical protein